MHPRCWLPRRSWRLEHNQCHSLSFFLYYLNSPGFILSVKRYPQGRKLGNICIASAELAFDIRQPSIGCTNRWSPRHHCPHLSRQLTEVVKTRGQISVKEIGGATAQTDPIKDVREKNSPEHQLTQVRTRTLACTTRWRPVFHCRYR
jgi:hypothetical protein